MFTYTIKRLLQSLLVVWAAVTLMFALFFMIAFVTGLQNPMGVIVKNQFQASNLLSQLGNFANFLAYAFMGIPAGLMLQKIGYKNKTYRMMEKTYIPSKMQATNYEDLKKILNIFDEVA